MYRSFSPDFSAPKPEDALKNALNLLFLDAQRIEFDYRNLRGEVSRRRVRIISMRYGVTEWHPEPGWLFEAFDYDKCEKREFALSGILPFGSIEENQ